MAILLNQCANGPTVRCAYNEAKACFPRWPESDLWAEARANMDNGFVRANFPHKYCPKVLET